MGCAAALATFRRQDGTENFQLALSWLSDKQNLPIINQIVRASRTRGTSRRLWDLPRSGGASGFGDAWSRPMAPNSRDLVLLDILFAEEGSLLFRIGAVLSRIEDLSHILVWASPQMADEKPKLQMVRFLSCYWSLFLQPGLTEHH